MGQKPDWAEQIARERIDILFEEAAKTYDEHPDRADRYVEIARNIGMALTVSIPREHRERFCNECYSYLKLGRNATLRTGTGEKRITCEACGNVMRFPYKE